MILFIHEGEKLQQNSGEDLVKQAFAIYYAEEISELDFKLAPDFFMDTDKIKILRTTKGKPYFKDIPIQFSISHSGNMWVCLMARKPVGVDIQEMREIQYLDIAKRFYTQEEIKYVELMGQYGFFQIWTMKESYIKYLGTGLSEGLNTFSVVQNNELLSSPLRYGKNQNVEFEIEYKGKIKEKTKNNTEENVENIQIRNIYISDEIYLAACTENLEEIEIRLI